MYIGVPTEVKNNEYRVALTPAGAHTLPLHNHDVAIPSGAGIGAGYSDDAYRAAGAPTAMLPSSPVPVSGRAPAMTTTVPQAPPSLPRPRMPGVPSLCSR